MLDPNQIFILFASLVGFPAFVASAVNAAKYFKLLLPDQAPKAVFWLTLIGFVGVAVAYFTGNVNVLSQIDAQLGGLALFITTFIAFVGDLGLAKVYHAGLRGAPVIGKSQSLEDAQKG